VLDGPAPPNAVHSQFWLHPDDLRDRAVSPAGVDRRCHGGLERRPQSAAVQGIPRFAWTFGSANVVVSDVDVNDSESEPNWCGHSSSVSGGSATVVLDHDPNCTNHDTYGSIMVHEFAHILGFPQSAHKIGVSGVSDHCAIHLPDSASGGGGPFLLAPVNSNPCSHEVEIIYEGYGQRSGPFVSTDFWGRHIVTGLIKCLPSA